MEELYYTYEEKYLCAMEEVRYGEPAKGKVMLEKILEEEPGYARAHYLLGYIYRNFFNDLERALTFYQTAVYLESTYVTVYYEYLYTLRRLNRKKQFEEVYAKALMIPAICKACLHIEAAYLAENNREFSKAIRYYEKALEANLGDCHSDTDEHILRVKAKQQKQQPHVYNVS